MIVTILHRSQAWLDEHRFEAFEESLAREVKLSDFVVVAVMEVPDLEAAYLLTQHTDHDWTENPSGVPMALSGLPCRSTAVGDVAVTDVTGMAWECGRYEWKPIRVL